MVRDWSSQSTSTIRPCRPARSTSKITTPRARCPLASEVTFKAGPKPPVNACPLSSYFCPKPSSAAK
jgi:hypothetical protein